MRKTVLYILILVFALLLTNYNAYSFKTNVTILVKGTVVDEYTGEPVETTVEFLPKNGRKFKIKTNSITGKFEQIFKAGDEVDVKFYYWNVPRTYAKIKVKDTIAFTEQEVQFKVKKLEAGRTLFRFNLFTPGTDNFSANSKEMLDSVEHLLRFSRNIKVEFKVNAHDTYAKVKKYVTSSKKKKNSKKLIVDKPDMNSVNALVEKRVAKLQSVVDKWKRYKRKIKITGDKSVLQTNNSATLDTNYDFEVIVTEVKKNL